MEGVKILFAKEITRSVWNGFVWHWGLALVILIGLIFIGIAIYASWQCIGSKGDIAFLLIAGTGMLLLGGFGFYLNGTVPVYDHTEYKVTVDETVNMNEFFEKYELIGQEGKIYIVKDEVPLSEE